MPYENAYLGAVLVSGGFALLAALWLWSEDLGLEARVFSVFMFLHPVVAVLVAAELVAPPGSGLATTLFALHNAAVLPVVPLWFAFAALYTGRRHLLSRPVIGVIAGWVLVTFLLQVTNPLHGLVWADFQVVTSPFPYVEGVGAPLFGVLTIPQPLLNLLAMGLLAHRFLFGSGITRSQTLVLFVGFLPPWVTFGAWTAGLLPGPLNGWFLIGSTWSFVLVGWAVYRYELFDIVPLARETVLGELDDPVVVVDEDLRLLDFNRAAAVAFPAVEEEPRGHVEALVPALVDREVEEGDPFVDSFTHYAEGGPREIDVSVSELSSAGEVRGYALVLRDVTEREQHVRDLERQTEQLERFASTLSHDLRNPLNVAHARVKMVMDSGSTEKLDRADEALDRIGGMIEDLLTLAREGRTIDEAEPVPLAEVFRDAWGTTDTKDARPSVDPDAEVVVFADRDRLQEVFENLVRNAVTHGGSDVTVTLGRHTDGFYVEDDGPGVPADERDSVFEFEYTTDEAGTGLGLAIVDAIAGAHGWRVEMAAGTDGGARIVFSGVDVDERAAVDREPAPISEAEPATEGPAQSPR